MGEMPNPPFPDPDNAALKLIYDEARQNLADGVDPLDVALHAAVHGWTEGHLEGHACDGDEEEPGDPSFRRALLEGRLEDVTAIAREMGADGDVIPGVRPR